MTTIANSYVITREVSTGRFYLMATSDWRLGDSHQAVAPVSGKLGKYETVANHAHRARRAQTKEGVYLVFADFSAIREGK